MMKDTLDVSNRTCNIPFSPSMFFVLICKKYQPQEFPGFGYKSFFQRNNILSFGRFLPSRDETTFPNVSLADRSDRRSNFVCRDEKETGRGKRKKRSLRKWVSCSAKFETGLEKAATSFFSFFIGLIVLMDCSFCIRRLWSDI